MSLLDRLGRKLGQLVDEMAVPDAIREDLVRGKAALEGGDPAEAEQRFRRATQGAPEHARAWHLLGLSQLRRDRPSAAVASLQRSLELEPGDFPVLLALAEAQRAMGEPDRALTSYHAALATKVDERLLDRLYGGLGELYLQRGEIERAVRELRKAVALSEGKDLGLVGQLGLAQLRDGDLSAARISLSRAAAAVPPDRTVLLGLAEVLLRSGQAEEARLAALRLLQEDEADSEARCLLGRSLLAIGDAQAARQELLHALQRAPRAFEVHRLLADVHLDVGDHDAAIRDLRTALSLEIPSTELGTDTRRQLLSCQLEAGTDPDVEQAELLPEDDALRLAALAVARRQADLSGAGELVRRALERSESHPVRLAQALIELEPGGDPEQAAAALRGAIRLEPGKSRARQLLGQLYDRLSRGAAGTGPTAFYPALRRIHHILHAHAEHAAAAAEVARIQEVFDRPLLVVVMGEFNSGKSTFVNALIGEEVAPMGVTPTTATINILKYGEKRAARVVHRDDREQQLAWDEVGDYLRGLDRDEAKNIREVELMFPSEELLRVNVVDTPGLNSMVDEHEETARQYMTRADAVVWLFSAGQAGKQTEQQALELLRQHRLKTVGVLNKVDRLSEAELEQVLAHLQREFTELVEAVVPVAARPALQALVSAGPEERTQQLEASRFPELRQFLEQRIFQRSRRIKREVCQRRLEQTLAAVNARAGATLEAADRAIAHIDEAGRSLAQHRDDRNWLERERLQLRQALRSVYREGAAEVLSFVRPRRWVLGEHRATQADRDYLLELLMDGLGRMADASADRLEARMSGLSAQLVQQLDPLLAAGPLSPLAVRLETVERSVTDRVQVMRQQVHGRYQAFTRGYLRGGRVDRFFEEHLPRLDLEQEAIYRALFADSVDLEQELLDPLASWYHDAVEQLRHELTRLRTEVDLLRLEQDRRIVGPLAEVAHRLGTVEGTA